MKLAKKILSICTIVFTVVVSLSLILLLFGFDIFTNIKLQVYLILFALAIGGFFAINSLNMVSKNKPIGWISFGLISGAVFLIIVSVFISNSILTKITTSLGLLSVLFTIIVSSGLDLGRHHKVCQIIVYVIVAITDVFTTLVIFGVFKLGLVLPYLISFIIVSLVGVIVLKILAKKQLGDRLEKAEREKNMIKISKVEYQMLVEKAKKYDDMISQNNQHQNSGQ